jgi:hypothetical protein
VRVLAELRKFAANLGPWGRVKCFLYLTKSGGLLFAEMPSVKVKPFSLCGKSLSYFSSLYGDPREHPPQLAPRPRRMTFAVSNIIAKSTNTDRCLM